jgi:type VII secretion-associated serine protease mycosin
MRKLLIRKFVLIFLSLNFMFANTSYAVESLNNIFTDRNSQFAEIIEDENGKLSIRISSGIESDVVKNLEKKVLAKGVINKRFAVNNFTTNNEIANLSQWYLERLEYDKVHKISTGNNIVIAVIDSGVDATHPDLVGSVLPGIDLIDRFSDGRVDPNGHGTHVAGIIAAHKNDFGTTGLAYGSKILPVRVLDQYGEGNDADIAFGILWAAKNGANIINLSLGGTKEDPLLRDAIAEVTKNGVLVVAASGNTGDSGDVFYPASNPSVVAVAATDLLDRVAIFSTRGEYVDVAAPGSMILSTSKDSTYKLDSGTSMATPLVSSILALLLSNGLSPNDSLERLYNTAYDIEGIGKDKESGYGLIDPYTALTSSEPRIKERANNIIDNKKFVFEPIIERSKIDFKTDIIDSNSRKLSKLKTDLTVTNKDGKKVIVLSANNTFLAFRKIEVTTVGVNNTRSKRIIRTDKNGSASIKIYERVSYYEIKYQGDFISLPISLKVSNTVQK